MGESFPLRSLFGVPMDQEDRLNEAIGSSADALMLDLTDLVAQTRRGEARENTRAFLDSGVGVPIWVRVARIEEEDAIQADLDAAVRPGLVGLVIPECERPDDLRRYDAWLTERERDRGLDAGSVKLLPLPESALAIRNYYDTLTASPRVAGAWFPGAPSGDLCRDVGYQWSEEGSERVYLRSKVVADARAAGIDSILDSGSGRPQDFEAFERESVISRRFGFTGRFVYNRTQAELANRLFGPSDEEIATAEREVAAYQESLERGVGMFELEGRVVDVTTVKYAERLLARAGRVT